MRSNSKFLGFKKKTKKKRIHVPITNNLELKTNLLSISAPSNVIDG